MHAMASCMRCQTRRQTHELEEKRCRARASLTEAAARRMELVDWLKMSVYRSKSGLCFRLISVH